EVDAGGDVLEDQHGAAALPRADLEGGDRDVDHHAAPVGGGQVQLEDVGDLRLLGAAEDEAAPQRLQEGLREDVVEGAAEDLFPRQAVEGLHRAVPARDLP